MYKLLIPLLIANSLFAEVHEAKEETYNYTTAQRYCATLGEGWRTLHIKELFELRGQHERFSSERSYWSADTADAGVSRQVTGSEGEMSVDAEYGYTFFLQDGDVTISPTKKQAGVLCTNTPYTPAKTDFALTEHGIQDPVNNIVWSFLDSHDKNKKLPYEEAQEYCENLELYDRSWRLPGVDELYAIVSYERTRPTVDTELFGIMISRYYWSDDEFNDDEAYVVGFKLGSVATSAKANHSYYRCVSDLDD